MNQRKYQSIIRKGSNMPKDEQNTKTETQETEDVPEMPALQAEDGKSATGHDLQDMLLTDEEKQAYAQKDSEEEIQVEERVEPETETETEEKVETEEEEKEEDVQSEEAEEMEELEEEAEDLEEKAEDMNPQELQEKLDTMKKRYKDLQRKFTKTSQKKSKFQKAYLDLASERKNIEQGLPVVDVNDYVDEEGRVNVEGLEKARAKAVAEYMDNQIKRAQRRIEMTVQNKLENLPKTVRSVQQRTEKVNQRTKALEEKYPVLTKNKDFRKRVAQAIVQAKREAGPTGEVDLDEVVEKELRVVSNIAKEQGFVEESTQEEEEKAPNVQQKTERDLPGKGQSDEDIAEEIVNAGEKDSILFS